MRRVLAIWFPTLLEDSAARAARRAGATPAAEAEQGERLMERLGRWAMRFTPAVGVDAGAAVLLLDLHGCERMWADGGANGGAGAGAGGENRLVDTLLSRLTRLGFRTQSALTGTVGASWALARFGEPGDSAVTHHRLNGAPDDAANRPRLHALPVASLRVHPVIVRGLSDVGIDRVGQLVALPRQEIAGRFGGRASGRGVKATRAERVTWGGGGVELLGRLDQMFGRAGEVVDLLREREPIRVTRRFTGPVSRLEVVGMALQDMLAELEQALLARESGARLLQVDFVWCGDNGVVSVRRQRLRLVDPARDAAHLWRLLETRVAAVFDGNTPVPASRGVPPRRGGRRKRRGTPRLTGGGNADGGVEEIEIVVERLSRRLHGQASMIDRPAGGGTDCDGATPSLLTGVADLLGERLGASRVCRCRWTPTHTPESAASWVPADGDDIGAGDAGFTRPDGPAADRPAVLLDRPRRIDVVMLQPEGPVMSLRLDGTTRRVRSVIGPERIARRWWLGGVMAEEVGLMVDVEQPDGAVESQPQPVPEAVGDAWPGVAGGAARNYFKVQDDTGRWWWVFRDLRTGRWSLQGWW